MLRDNLTAMKWITCKVYELEDEELYLEIDQDLITIAQRCFILTVMSRYKVDEYQARDAISNVNYDSYAEWASRGTVTL